MSAAQVWKGIDETELLRIARRLGKRARGGELICLEGPLGAGKTTFAQGFARGAGFRGEVTSPTFAIVNQYALRAQALKRIYHLDLYRLKPGELANVGVEEYLADAQAACLIEWPQAAAALLPRDFLQVSIAHAARGRDMRLYALGPRSRALLVSLRHP